MRRTVKLVCPSRHQAGAEEDDGEGHDSGYPSGIWMIISRRFRRSAEIHAAEIDFGNGEGIRETAEAVKDMIIRAGGTSELLETPGNQLYMEEWMKALIIRF